MRLIFTIIIFLQFTLSQEIASITLNIKETQSDEWWSKFNQKGIDSSNFHLSYNFKIPEKKISLHSNLYIEKNSFILGESILSISLKEIFKLKVGRYYRDFSSYLNDNLSSGSLLISRNTYPLPKVGFLGKTKNKNSFINYGIAHGIFDKNDIYLEAPFLHEKFLYYNYKNKKNSFSIGLVHEAIWAGHVKGFGKQPANFEDFFRIFRASHGDENALETDQINALGNHLGIWDFSFSHSFNEKIIKFYYQHLFEDESGFKFKNNYDGLWGIELLNNKFNLLIEYLNTTDQSNSFGKGQGNDSYYNHGVYLDGWSYKEFSLGSPFIDFNQNIPVEVLHFGFSTKKNNNFYKILTSKRLNNSQDVLFNLNYKKYIRKKTIGISLSNSISNQIIVGISYSYKFE
tara:strand:- start:4374 stop:5576 length:1203 start_codon:yes stop_codon:yes gene_type:complete